MSLMASGEKIGVLVSGGLDSSILVGHLLALGREVQPLYIRTGVWWEAGELASLRRYLGAVGGLAAADGAAIRGELAPAVTLELPLGDLYTDHWSLTGKRVPDARTPDEAVYLPGRNALLLVKAAVWCQLHAIGELAMAPLGTSPFDDASEAFFRDFELAINRGCQAPVRLLRPFGTMKKRQVMELGRKLPLELTFSCIAPVGDGHCGTCNKCAERKLAFRDAEIPDNTCYAA